MTERRRFLMGFLLLPILLGACESVGPGTDQTQSQDTAPVAEANPVEDTTPAAPEKTVSEKTVSEKLAGLGDAAPSKRALFEPINATCFARQTLASTAVVDVLLHPRPMVGAALPWSQTIDYMGRAGILFAAVSGSGRAVGGTGLCPDPEACSAAPAPRVLKHDFANAQDVIERGTDDITLTLSMTFADLSRPEDIQPALDVLDTEYPGVFRIMGPVDLANQSLAARGENAVALETIGQWAPFMDDLRERTIPLMLRADLGTDDAPTEYLPLLEEVLTRYPDNAIIWVGLGVWSGTAALDPADHVALVSALMTRHPNLYGTVSGPSLYAFGFQDPERRAAYVTLLNTFADRLLPGTDFTAFGTADYLDYRNRLVAWGEVFASLKDDAFRAIALADSYFKLVGLPYRAPDICDQKL